MSNVAVVDAQNPKVPPTLTPGKVTPKILHGWQWACKEYFGTKCVAEDAQVESVLYQLEDMDIVERVEADEAALISLPFTGLMVKLREQVLEKDWNWNLKLLILGLKQGERPFGEWENELKNCNTLL